MITKHCVRFSLSLCPKQAKGVTGVQGTVRAEPLQLVNGKEKLTLRFDCKPCEMHVVGKMKTSIAKQSRQDGQQWRAHHLSQTAADSGIWPLKIWGDQVCVSARVCSAGR
jgi:hypothetical protein